MSTIELSKINLLLIVKLFNLVPCFINVFKIFYNFYTLNYIKLQLRETIFYNSNPLLHLADIFISESL